MINTLTIYTEIELLVLELWGRFRGKGTTLHGLKA